MALRQLYALSTGSLNPSGMTNLQPGGAGVQTAGSSPNPGISAPYVEQVIREVYDLTAPTLIVAGTTAPTPAPAGKLLVWDPVNTAFGSGWKLNSVQKQAVPTGMYGVVYSQGTVPTGTSTKGSSNGNIADGPIKSTVVTEGPVQAYVNTTVTNTAISAGMALAADGAGNLTYAGASPAVGTVLGWAAGNQSAGVSTPALMNVYLGGY